MSRRNVPKFELFDLSDDQLSEIIALNPTDGFRKIDPDCLSGLIPKTPQAYLKKCNSVLLITSGGMSYDTFGATMYRVDGNEIDQDQILVVTAKRDPTSGKGIKVGHGDYPARTSFQSPEFRSGLLASGVSTTAPIPDLPENDSGSLEELVRDQRAGFDYAEEFVNKYVLNIAVLQIRTKDDDEE